MDRTVTTLRSSERAHRPGRGGLVGRALSFGLQPGAVSRLGPTGSVGVCFLALLAVLALAAPILPLADPLVQDREAQFRAPSASSFFGTDEFGRDILARVVWGARVTLATGLGAVTIACALGAPLGLAAGYFSGWVDTLVSRFVELLLAVPAILLAMAVIAVVGPGAINLMLALGIVAIPPFVRLARASTLTERGREYVLAARAVGAADRYIMFRTILPNALNPIVVQCTVACAHAVLLEAALSFLGLGSKPPEPSWGLMLNTARGVLHRAPWYGIFPGLVITGLVLALNAAADALQDVLDPGGRTAAAGGPT